MAEPYWVDRAVRIAADRIQHSKVAMQGRLGKPRTRRPNTRNLLAQALANPGNIPEGGRETLARFAHERYGEAADLIMPYLIEPQEELEEGDASTRAQAP